MARKGTNLFSWTHSLFLYGFSWWKINAIHLYVCQFICHFNQRSVFECQLILQKLLVFTPMHQQKFLIAEFQNHHSWCEPLPLHIVGQLFWPYMCNSEKLRNPHLCCLCNVYCIKLDLMETYVFPPFYLWVFLWSLFLYNYPIRHNYNLLFNIYM